MVAIPASLRSIRLYAAAGPFRRGAVAADRDELARAALLDPAVASPQRDAARPSQLDHAEAAEELEQRLELLRLPRRLEREGRVRDVHDVDAEHRGDLHDALPVVRFGPHLHQHQLALDGRALVVLEDLD